MKIKSAILIFFSFFLSVACDQQGVTIIGLDKEGKPVSFSVNQDIFKKEMGSVLTSVSSSTIPVLDRGSSQELSLSAVVVGFSLKAEGGLGPIINGSIEPRFRVIFTNVSENVPLPIQAGP